MFDAETGMPSEKFLERFPLMSGGVIQKHDDGAAQVPQQSAQKRADFLLADIVKEEKIVEAEVVPLGTDRNSGYYRHFVPPSLAMSMNGSFSLRGPGPHYCGD